MPISKSIAVLASGLFIGSASLIMWMTEAVARPESRPTFEQLDSNADGMLSQEELTAQAKKRFERGDADGNGTLSSQEMIDDFLTQSERGTLPAQKLFDGSDKNNDGLISEEEMRRFSQARERRGVRHPMRQAIKKMQALDLNGDSMVSKEELASEVKGDFESIDTDADGKVTRKEMVASVRARAQKRAVQAKTRFNDADGNGDGLLSEEEIMPAFISGIKRRAKLRIQATIEHADQNLDGVVSFEELTNARRNSDQGHGFARFDKDNDGMISKSEFESGAPQKRQMGSRSKGKTRL